MKVGDHMKINLPGESPWAEVMVIHSDGSWDGRIDNELVCGPCETGRKHMAQQFGVIDPPILHPYSRGDVVRFQLSQPATRTTRDIWTPAMERLQ